MSADLVRAGAGGFLLAVLLADLSFDVRAVREGGEALDAAAAYYRALARRGSPLATGTVAVMLALVTTIALDAWRAPHMGLLTDALALAPVALALTHTMPSAHALTRSSDDSARAALARRIARDHVFSTAAMTIYLALVLVR